MPNTKKSRAREIKELFKEYLKEGEWGLYMWCLAACIKAKNAARWPNDTETVREYQRWMRVYRSHSLKSPAPEKRNPDQSSVGNVITMTDAIRARALGVRLD